MIRASLVAILAVLALSQGAFLNEEVPEIKLFRNGEYDMSVYLFEEEHTGFLIPLFSTSQVLLNLDNERMRSN